MKDHHQLCTGGNLYLLDVTITTEGPATWTWSQKIICIIKTSTLNNNWSRWMLATVVEYSINVVTSMHTLYTNIHCSGRL